MKNFLYLHKESNYIQFWVLVGTVVIINIWAVVDAQKYLNSFTCSYF